jgi:hypothetical protein
MLSRNGVLPSQKAQLFFQAQGFSQLIAATTIARFQTQHAVATASPPLSATAAAAASSSSAAAAAAVAAAAIIDQPTYQLVSQDSPPL